MTDDALDAGLQKLRSFLSGDGADLLLENAVDGQVQLRLDLSRVDCLDCVLPNEYLTGVITDVLTESLGYTPVVTLYDPRADSEPVAPIH